MANVISILNTNQQEVGRTYILNNRQLSGAISAYLEVQLSPGDQIIFEGKLIESSEYKPIATFTTNSIVQINLPRIYRAKRNVSGNIGPAHVYLQTIDTREQE